MIVDLTYDPASCVLFLFLGHYIMSDRLFSG